ncbi:hypothetical protein NVP1084O_001 [Vibrio phage 1.084.O._10N.261.49.F5]|nr:hypothetical protein NVP1084O_001 [Vibrio phage 1.084.O._10N.261.49.F5]
MHPCGANITSKYHTFYKIKLQKLEHSPLCYIVTIEISYIKYLSCCNCYLCCYATREGFYYFVIRKCSFNKNYYVGGMFVGMSEYCVNKNIQRMDKNIIVSKKRKVFLRNRSDVFCHDVTEG